MFFNNITRFFSREYAIYHFSTRLLKGIRFLGNGFDKYVNLIELLCIQNGATVR